MSELGDRRMLITGASSGIGLATAQLAAERGAYLILLDQREDIVGIADDLGGEGHRVDLGSPTDIETALDGILADHGRIDVLANVAGIYPARRFLDMDDAFLAGVMDINLFSVFRLCRRVAPVMLANGGGSIVNISSGAASRAFKGLAAYAASKAALVAMSRTLALELAPTLRVNVVAPGATASPTVLDALRTASNEAAVAAQNDIPLGRMADPAEIAEAILFLASDRSRFITGATIAVNGGSQMA